MSDFDVQDLDLLITALEEQHRRNGIDLEDIEEDVLLEVPPPSIAPPAMVMVKPAVRETVSTVATVATVAPVAVAVAVAESPQQDDGSKKQNLADERNLGKEEFFQNNH